MANFHANQFHQDPRVLAAIQTILTCLSEHQKNITSIQPPHEDKKISYDTLLKHCSELRGGELYYPYLGTGFGKGCFVELADGSIKYDLITGIGVHGWGHSHPHIVEACLRAALEDTVMQGNLQQNRSTVALLDLLLKGARAQGACLDHCFLTSSGAMANENALKMIFQKKAPASRILSFQRCFSGRTLALSHVTDRPAYRQGLPETIAVDYVPFFDAERPKESTAEALACLKGHLNRYPRGYACMMFELIQGEGGYYPGERSFFVALMDMLKAHDIAIFIDEIQTFGRTKSLFAFQHYGLDAYVDVVSIGKMAQVCATLYRHDFQPKPGLISQTFTSSTMAIYAAIVMVDALLHQDFLGDEGKIEKLHQHFISRLAALSMEHPGALRGPYGIGGMIAMTVFDGSLDATKAFLRELFDQGVMGFLAGQNPYRVRFLLPIGAIETQDIDNVCVVLKQAIQNIAG